jgi:hypothetical protein
MTADRCREMLIGSPRKSDEPRGPFVAIDSDYFADGGASSGWIVHSQPF